MQGSSVCGTSPLPPLALCAPSLLCPPLYARMPDEPDAHLRADCIHFDPTPGATLHEWRVSYVNATKSLVLLDGAGTCAGVMNTLVDLSSAGLNLARWRDGTRLLACEALVMRMTEAEGAARITAFVSMPPSPDPPSASASASANATAAAAAPVSQDGEVTLVAVRPAHVKRETPAIGLTIAEFLATAPPPVAIKAERGSPPAPALDSPPAQRRKRRRRRRDRQRDVASDSPPQSGSPSEHERGSPDQQEQTSTTTAQQQPSPIVYHCTDRHFRAVVVPARGSRTAENGARLYFWRVSISTKRTAKQKWKFVHQGWYGDRAQVSQLIAQHARAQRLLPEASYPDMAVVRSKLDKLTYHGQHVCVALMKSEGPHPELEDTYYWHVNCRLGGRYRSILSGWRTVEALVVDLKAACSSNTPPNNKRNQAVAKHAESHGDSSSRSSSRSSSSSASASSASSSSRCEPRRKRQRRLAEHARTSCSSSSSTSASSCLSSEPERSSECHLSHTDAPRPIVVTRGTNRFRASVVLARGVRSCENGGLVHFWRVRYERLPHKSASLFVYQGWHERTALAGLMDLHAHGQRLLPSPTYPDVSVIRAMLADVTFGGQRVHIALRTKRGPHPEDDNMFFWRAHWRQRKRRTELLAGWRTELGFIAELRAKCSARESHMVVAVLPATNASGDAGTSASPAGARRPHKPKRRSRAAASAASAHDSSHSTEREATGASRPAPSVEKFKDLCASVVAARGTRKGASGRPQQFWRVTRSQAGRGERAFVHQGWYEHAAVAELLKSHASGVRPLAQPEYPDLQRVRKLLAATSYRGQRPSVKLDKAAGPHAEHDGMFYWHASARVNQAEHTLLSGWRTQGDFVAELRALCNDSAAAAAAAAPGTRATPVAVKAEPALATPQGAATARARRNPLDSMALRQSARTATITAKYEEQAGTILLRAEKIGERGARPSGEAFWRFRSRAGRYWTWLGHMWLRDADARRMLADHASGRRLLPEPPAPDERAVERATSTLRFRGRPVFAYYRRDRGAHPLCDGAYYWNVRLSGDGPSSSKSKARDQQQEQIFGGWQTPAGLADELRSICAAGQAPAVDVSSDASNFEGSDSASSSTVTGRVIAMPPPPTRARGRLARRADAPQAVVVAEMYYDDSQWFGFAPTDGTDKPDYYRREEIADPARLAAVKAYLAEQRWRRRGVAPD